MSSSSHDMFAELYMRHQRRLYGYIATLLPNQADAEEVFQQTGLLLWKKWDQFDPDADFMRWCCGLARNEVRNFVRLRRHKDVYFSPAMLECLAEEHVTQSEEEHGRQEALGHCLNQLPQRQRELVDLCYRGTGSIKTVAAKLRLAPTAVYQRLHRIRRLLMECIERTLREWEHDDQHSSV